MLRNNQYYSSDDYIVKAENLDTLLSTDSHFKYSFAIGNHIIESHFMDEMNSCALVILKPESFITGKANKILQLLDDLSLTPIYYKFVQLNSAQVHDIWKLQWRTAALERIIINCQAMEYSKILVLIVRGHEPTTSISNHLASLKGSAIAARRKEYHLRSRLNAINIVLNFIHVSDNTFEMIREMGIVFLCGELPTVYEQIKKSKFVKYTAFRNDIEKTIHDMQLIQSHPSFDIQSLLELSGFSPTAFSGRTAGGALPN